MAPLDPANVIASRDEVLATKELLDIILSHLDPASVKEAMLVSRYLVGKDGRTAYERRTGRKCRVPVVPFGEAAMYLPMKTARNSKGQQGKRANAINMQETQGKARTHNERQGNTEHRA